jgi:hypothetical protein
MRVLVCEKLAWIGMEYLPRLLSPRSGGAIYREALGNWVKPILMARLVHGQSLSFRSLRFRVDSGRRAAGDDCQKVTIL